MNVWEFLILIITFIFLHKNQDNGNQYFSNFFKNAYRFFMSNDMLDALIRVCLILLTLIIGLAFILLTMGLLGIL